MGRNEEKKLQKRTALMNSAYELFTTTGFHKTPVLAITLKAGVSKGSFYNYFKDKEAIRDALIIQKSGELLNEGLNALSSSGQAIPPIDKFVFLINYVLDRLSEDLALLRFISKNLSWGLFSNAERYQKDACSETIDFRAFITHMLEEDGILPTKKIELAIFTILELINSTCYNVILYGEPASLSEYKPYLFRCVRQIFTSSLEPEGTLA